MLIDYVEKGKIINGENNPPVHTSSIVIANHCEVCFELLPQAAYPPSLSPNEFYCSKEWRNDSLGKTNFKDRGHRWDKVLSLIHI